MLRGLHFCSSAACIFFRSRLIHRNPCPGHPYSKSHENELTTSILVTARDPSEPYYDPKDKGDEPRWSVVHVEFRQKFDQQITLPELKEWNKKGQPLENMQMLNSARLSVSKVSKDEWEFLMGVVEERKVAAGEKED